MPAPYRLILFDFDGTLVDTVPDIAYYVNRVLKAHGHAQVPLDRVKGAIGWGVSELLKILAPAYAADAGDLERSVAEFKDAYRQEPVRVTRPFPHVVEMLDGPLRSTRKSIVTNKPQDITLKILDELGLARFFEHVIGMHGDFPPKPDPSSIRHLMGLAGVLPGQTVYIGDSSVDAEASRAAGVDFVWMRYGYQGAGDGEPQMRLASALDWKRLVS